jgi:hypothetical protein
MASNHYPLQTTVDDDQFAVGDVVKATGWRDEWIIAEIMPEEAGIPTDKPFHLRSVDRDDTDGYPTRFGTIPHGSENDRYVWIWVAGRDLTLVRRPSQELEVPQAF